MKTLIAPFKSKNTIQSSVGNHKKAAINLGIWMDHSSAHIMEFTKDPIETITINSKFTHQEKELSLVKGESQMHNKEQHQQLEYYKKISESIINCTEVVIFGPTDAKIELFNILRADHRFAKIKIEIRQTDKLTEHQQQSFMRIYFSRQ